MKNFREVWVFFFCFGSPNRICSFLLTLTIDRLTLCQCSGASTSATIAREEAFRKSARWCEWWQKFALQFATINRSPYRRLWRCYFNELQATNASSKSTTHTHIGEGRSTTGPSNANIAFWYAKTRAYTFSNPLIVV